CPAGTRGSASTGWTWPRSCDTPAPVRRGACRGGPSRTRPNQMGPSHPGPRRRGQARPAGPHLRRHPPGSSAAGVRTPRGAGLRRLLRASRLVTLTGRGGCGKTRLAAQVGRRLAGRTPDGVYWVDLSRHAPGGSVTEAVAAALGLRDQPAVDRLDELCRHAAGRSALIVLDNCEHLLDSCARTMARLLAAAPSLALLATSRGPVGVGR